MCPGEDLRRELDRDRLFGVPGGYAQYLGPAEEEALQGLLERCDDCFQLVRGESPSSSAAQALRTQRPEGKGYIDKLVIGFYGAGDRLVGVLDAIRDYPAHREWWLGLLLLEPQERNRGRGEEWDRAFEEWMGEQGARNVSLGVVEQNQMGLRFWGRMGFEVLERRRPQPMGERESVTVVMGRDLAA